MKNADMPAMPVVTVQRIGNVEKSTSEATGLTKREMMAMFAMQGLISSGATYGGRTDARDALSRDAIAHADALLLELDRTSK